MGPAPHRLRLRVRANASVWARECVAEEWAPAPANVTV